MVTLPPRATLPPALRRPCRPQRTRMKGATPGLLAEFLKVTLTRVSRYLLAFFGVKPSTRGAITRIEYKVIRTYQGNFTNMLVSKSHVFLTFLFEQV